MPAHGGSMRPSLAQERLWLVHQRDPDRGVHNLCWAHRLRGHLDIAALSRSVRLVVRRHEALRTSFRNAGGRPVLVTSQEGSAFLELGPPCRADDREIQAMADALASRPVDVSREPLVRFVLIPIGTDDHLFVIVAHELVFDSSSIGVVYDELADHYGAEVQGIHLVETIPPLQPSELERRRRELLSDERLELSIRYWAERLGGAFPVDRPLADRTTAEAPAWGRRARGRIDAFTTRAIEGFCRDMQASTLSVLLAAWVSVLHRHGAGTDLLVGVKLSGRADPAARDVVGQLSRMVAIRCDLHGDPTIRDLVARIRDDALRDEPHYVAPLEAVLDTMLRTRPPGPIETIFDHRLVLIDAATTSFTLPGIDVQTLPVDVGFALGELTFEVVPRAGVLDLTLEYATDVYTETMAERVLADARSVLEAIASRPDVRLSMISLGEEARGNDE